VTKALILLSGGIDSATCASLAVRDHGAKNVHAVSFIYGQKHDKEVAAAYRVSKALELSSWRQIHLPNEFRGSGSTLIDEDKDNPECSYDEIEGVSPTYVPFRNGILTSYAAAVALTSECDLIYFGAHSEDASNWAYPDCTPEFIGAMSSAIYVGTYHKVRLITPLQWMDKKAVVQTGLYLGTPYHLTWSCYNGEELACGVCPTCRSRREAFAFWGSKDPLDYADEVPADG